MQVMNLGTLMGISVKCFTLFTCSAAPHYENERLKYMHFHSNVTVL